MGILDIFKKKESAKVAPQKPEKTSVSEKMTQKPEVVSQKVSAPKPVQTLKKAAKDKKVAAKAVKEVKKNSGDAHKTFIRHIVTEKSTRLQEKANQYTFEVSRNTNKVEIRKALQALYGVTPEKVTILNKVGKYGRFGLYYGQQKTRKKAVVILKKGDKINTI